MSNPSPPLGDQTVGGFVVDTTQQRATSFFPERCDELREVLAATPPLLARAGTVAVLVAVLLALTLACVIEQPETVQAAVTVTGSSRPVPVLAGADGRIARLLVRDGAQVTAGQTLAIIESQ